MDGTITAFRDTPDAVVLRFGDFQPADRPGYSARALGFEKSDDAPHLRQAYVRITVDGRSGGVLDAVCHVQSGGEKRVGIPKALQKKTVAGNGRRVELSFAPESFHIGYSVNLHKAWRNWIRGPASPRSTAARSIWCRTTLRRRPSSADLSPKQLPKYENLLVTLNAPLDFADPAVPGRSYRMFQSTMPGPSILRNMISSRANRFICRALAQLRPGRGLTYVGCLLIVAGIFVAYFVRFVRNPAQEGER